MTTGMTADDAMEAFSRLLLAFGRRTGLGDVTPDAEGGCRFVVDDHLAVDVDAVPDDGMAYLHAPVGPVPADADARLYRTLLEEALFGAHTHGASLGIDPDTGEIILFRGISLAVDHADFEAAVSNFVTALGVWKSRADAGALIPSPGEGAQTRSLASAIKA